MGDPTDFDMVPGSTLDDYAPVDSPEYTPVAEVEPLQDPAPPQIPAYDFTTPAGAARAPQQAQQYNSQVEAFGAKLRANREANKKREEAAQIRAENAQKRMIARQTGAQFQADATSRLQPVIDPVTGKQRFTESTSPVRYTETGEPFQVKTTETGSREIINPDANAPIRENPNDPNDRFLYRQNQYKEWEPIDPDEALTSGDPRMVIAASKTLHARKIKDLDTQRAEISLRLKDPARPSRLTPNTRTELEQIIAARSEPAEKPQTKRGMFGGVDAEATARLEAEWKQGEDARIAQVTQAQQALAADDERQTLETQSYELEKTLFEEKQGGPAAFLKRRREELAQGIATGTEEESKTQSTTVAGQLQDRSQSIIDQRVAIQERAKELDAEAKRGATAERMAQIVAERQKLNNDWNTLSNQASAIQEEAQTIDTALQERAARQQKTQQEAAQRRQALARQQTIQQRPAMAQVFDKIDATEADIQARREKVEAMPESPVKAAALRALDADASNKRKEIQREMGVALGDVKSLNPAEWDEADKAAFASLDPERKRAISQAWMQEKLVRDIQTRRDEIRNEQFQAPENWQSLSPDQKRAIQQEFATRKIDTLRAFDNTESRKSQDRKEIIDGLSGITPGEWRSQLSRQLKGRVKTAAAASGLALSAVGTGVLDIATAVQSALGADPDDTWTRQMSSSIRDYYDSAMDDDYRDAAFTNIVSGLSSALSFMAPGSAVGKIASITGAGSRVGGFLTKIIPALRNKRTAEQVGQMGSQLIGAAITGAVINGGAAYGEALDMGLSKPQSFARLGVGFGFGFTEAAGVGGVLAKLDRLGKGSVSKFFIELTKQGSEEGIQEFTQAAGTDLMDLLILDADDPRKKSMDKIIADAKEAGIWGAVTGVLFTGFVSAAVRRDRRNAGLPEDPEFNQPSIKIGPNDSSATGTDTVRNPEDIATAMAEIDAMPAGPSIVEDLEAQRKSATDPEQIAQLDAQIAEAARIEPAKMPPEAKQDLARALVKIATGEVTSLDQLSAAERTAVSMAKTRAGTAFVEQAAGEMQIITDPALEWLESVSPAARALATMTEAEVKAFADQKAAPPQTSSTSSTPSTLQVADSIRYEELQRKAQGTPARQIAMPDGSMSTSPARPPQPLTPEEQQELVQLEAQLKNPTGTAAPSAPPIPQGDARQLTEREAKTIDPRMVEAIATNNGISEADAELIAIHEIRNNPIQKGEKPFAILKRINDAFLAKGGAAKITEITAAIRAQEQIQSRETDTLTEQAVTALESQRGAPLADAERTVLRQAIDRLTTTIRNWNTIATKINLNPKSSQSGGVQAEVKDGSLTINITDLLATGNLQQLLSKADRPAAIIFEEITHIVQISLAASKMKARGYSGNQSELAMRYFDEVWQQLPAEARKAVEGIYAPRSKIQNSAVGGAEFMRMLVQGEIGIDATGRITDSKGAQLSEQLVGKTSLALIRDALRDIMAYINNIAGQLRKSGAPQEFIDEVESFRAQTIKTLREAQKAADASNSAAYQQEYELQLTKYSASTGRAGPGSAGRTARTDGKRSQSGRPDAQGARNDAGGVEDISTSDVRSGTQGKSSESDTQKELTGPGKTKPRKDTHKFVRRKTANNGQPSVVFADSMNVEYSVPDRDAMPDGAESAQGKHVVLWGNYAGTFTIVGEGDPTQETRNRFGPDEVFYKAIDNLTGRSMAVQASDIQRFAEQPSYISDDGRLTPLATPKSTADNNAGWKPRPASQQTFTSKRKEPAQSDDVANVFKKTKAKAKELSDAEKAAKEEAEMRADMEGNLRNVGNEQGYELIEALEIAGGLPSKENPNRTTLLGELDRVLSAARSKVNKGGSAFTGRIFRRDANNLDQTRQVLEGYGFFFATPADMLEAIENRLTTGTQQYGNPEASGESALQSRSADVTDRDTDYLAAVKRGDTVAAQRMVAEHQLAIAREEIVRDIESGIIPTSVKSFSELQDYVDANEYVNDGDRADRRIGPLGKALGWQQNQFIDFTNRLINNLDSWLQNGRPLVAGSATGSSADSRYLDLAKDPQKNAAELRRMVDEATSSPEWHDAKHGTPETTPITIFGRRGALTGANSAKKAFFFSDAAAVTDTYRMQNRGEPDSDAINRWVDTLTDNQVAILLPRNRRFVIDSDFMREYARDTLKEELADYTNEIGEDIRYTLDDVVGVAKANKIPVPAELDPSNIGRTYNVKLRIANPYRFTAEDVESDGMDSIIDNAIAGGHDGIISRDRVADAFVGFDNKNPPAGIIYAVFEPSQIKSADSVTYYPEGHPRAGEPIALSERFNPESNSILQSRSADISNDESPVDSKTKSAQSRNMPEDNRAAEESGQPSPGGRVARAIEQVKQLAADSNSYQEFKNATRQAHLIDLSNPETHWIGRAIAPYKGEPYEDIQQFLDEKSAYLEDIKYTDQDIYRAITSPKQTITVYRAVPTDRADAGIRVGDYVALTQRYAQMHLESVLEAQQGVEGKIISEEVPKRDVIWGQADWQEWAYSPRELRDAIPSLEELFEARPDSPAPSTSAVSPVDASAARAYAINAGASNIEEATDGITRTLQFTATGRVGESGSYVQSDLFGGPETESAGTTAIAPGQAAAAALRKANAGKDGQAGVASADLIAGLQGDWKALAREIDAKGRASSIYADLVTNRIPDWDVTGTKIEGPEDVMAVMQPIRSPYFESLKVMVMDGNNNVAFSQIVHVGALAESIADPRRIFSALVRMRESAGKNYNNIIISHNHPSGDPSPSTADINLQKRLNEIAKVVGFKVSDHVITNGENYFSFRDSGLISTASISKGYTPKKDTGTKPKPNDPLAIAPWEAIRRSKLSSLNDSDKLAKAAKFLRNGNPDSAHILYLNTKLKLTAIERISLSDYRDNAKRNQIILSGMAREGGYGFSIEAPGSQPTSQDLEIQRNVSKFASLSFMHAVDIVLTNDNAGQSNPYFSFREAGLMEAPANYNAQETSLQSRSADATNDDQLELDFEAAAQDAAKTPAQRLKENASLIGQVTAKFANMPGFDRDEATQRVRIAIVRASQAYDGARGIPFEALARTTATNELRSMYRQNMRQATRFPASMDDPVGEDGASTRGDITPDTRTRSPLQSAADREASEMVDRIIANLPDRLRLAVQGFQAGKNGEEIAAEMGITRQGVNNLQKAGFERMRRMLGEQGVTTTDDVVQVLQSRAADIDSEQTQEVNTKFYSRLERVLESKIQGKQATPDQIQAAIDPARGSGVKAEEIKWSGIQQAIDRIARKNGGKVPKDALLNYLRDEGAVRFEEVTLGSPSKQWTQDDIDRLEKEAQRTRQWDAYERAVLEYEDQQLGSDANNTGNQTKYAQYQLPGGENYREVVLAMPMIGPRIIDSRNGKVVWEGSDTTPRTGVDPEAKAFAERYFRPEERKFAVYQRASGSDYTSTHFPDVPNYVAHMRLNERIDAKGKPGLFIEEIQSDRHQEGRKKGYSDGSEKFQKPTKTILEDGRIQVDFPNGQTVTFREGMENLADAAIERHADIQREPSYGKGIADAPFRTTWPLALFKRALRDAVADGKDWIGWTTGETQNDRFDLSKSVDSIEVEARDGTFHDVRIFEKSGSVIDLEVDEGMVKYGQFANKRLDEIIGKDMAEKILAVENDTAADFSGDGLKVGGSGMRGFYDTILPKDVGKYVKQWGATVEKAIIGGNAAAIDARAEEIFSDWEKTGENYSKNYSDAQEQAYSELGQNGVFKNVPIWRVDITPQMRESIQTQGQSLFSAPVDPDSKSDEDPIDALLRELEQDIDFDAAFDMQTAANAEQAAGGKQTIGRPDLARGADNADVRGIDAYYTAKFVPETEAKWEQEATEMLANDYEGTRKQIEMLGLTGQAIPSPSMVVAANRIADDLKAKMDQTGSDEDRKAFNRFWYAKRKSGSEWGRVGRAMRDMFKTPAMRYREFLIDMVTEPSVKAQRRIDAAPTEAEQSARIADLERKLRLAIAQANAIQRNAIAKELEAERKVPTKEIIIDAEMAKLLEKLQKAGISPEDILQDRAKLSLKNKKIIDDFTALFAAAAASSSKDGDAKRRAFALLRKNKSFKDIATTTGLTENAVRKLKADFIAQMRRDHFGKFMAGMNMEGEMSISDAKVKPEVAERNFAGWLNTLGIVDDAKQGKPKFDIEDPAHVMRMVRTIQSVKNATVLDMAYEWWIMNILSGLQTQVVNIGGNTLATAWDMTLQRSVEASLNLMIKDSKSAQLGEFQHLAKGLIPGIVKGWKEGVKSWSAENDFFENTVLGTPIELNNFDKAGNVRSAIPGKAGRVIRIPGRALLFADAIFKTVIGQMEAGAQAYRIAKAEGLTGQKMSDRIALLTKTRGQVIAENLATAAPSGEMVQWFADHLIKRDPTLDIDALLTDKTSIAWDLAREQAAFEAAKAKGWKEDAWQIAVTKAKELTFQTDLQNNQDVETAQKQGNAQARTNVLESGAKYVQQAARTSKLLGFFFPFVRTPYNIFRMGLRKSPLGSANLAYQLGRGLVGIRDGQPFLRTNPTFARDLSEQVIAWGAFMALYAAAQGDEDDDDKMLLITGSQPYNLTRRGIRDLNDRAYGGTYIIRIGGRNGIKIPYGRMEPIGTVLGTVIDMIRMHKSPSTAPEKLDAFWGFLLSQAKDQTFLQGFTSITEILEGSKAPVAGFNRGLMQAIVPNIIRQPLRNLDDYVRESKTAGLDYQLFPSGDNAEERIDIYGKPIEKGWNPIGRLFINSPLATDDRLNAADAMLIRWNTRNPGESYAPEPPRAVIRINGEDREMTAEEFKKFSTLAGRILAYKIPTRITPAVVANPTQDDVDWMRKAVTDSRAEAKKLLFPGTR